MASNMSIRPAHPQGPTFLTYTPNGRKLVTVGSNNTIRVFETGSDGEPTNIDDTRDTFTAVVATNDSFIVGSEDGSVCSFSLTTNNLDEVLTRCTLPIRDLALSPDKQWLAVASDELLIKIVYISDMTRVRYIRDLSKPIKHLAFDFNGQYLMASCSDGVVYVYDMMGEQPELFRQVDGLIRAVETDVQASSAVVWHPDGRAFAAATATRDVQVMSKRDWERQRSFSDGHSGDITALSWSPNGALLVTAGMDRCINLWDTKTQKVLKRFDNLRAAVWAFSWHPEENILCYTTNAGEVHIHSDFVPQEHLHVLQKGLQPAPFIHDPLAPVSGNVNRQPNGGGAKGLPPPRRRAGTPDSLDEILGPDNGSDMDGFVEDDDGFGYAEAPQSNGHGKRTSDHLDIYTGSSKRRAVWQPRIHEAFQPGSTPWRGNRRYLCLNLLGCIWTVDQDTHHSVTVEFYDREFQRDFHFTDPFHWDKACLTMKGALFSCEPSDDGSNPAYLFYRPHETWTTRNDWRIPLPHGESLTSIALSDSYIVATTSANYVRIYTLFGTPVKVYRHKSAPIVSCASWRDYVLIMGNGAVGADGSCRLTYSIENVKRDDVCQSEDIVAVPEGEGVSSVFFSDTGDPHIYDTTGTLLVLLHWRIPTAATWVPLLSTRHLARNTSGTKTESYYPVGVSSSRFTAIILKGGDKYPWFPRPLLSEFDFHIPITSGPSPSDPSDSTSASTAALQETHLRLSTQHALQSDALASTTSRGAASARAALARTAVDIDKTLLQLLAAACVDGEHTGPMGLELVRLLRDRSGRLLEAAGRIAGRYGREGLRSRIREIEEARAVGLDDGSDDGDGLEDGGGDGKGL